MTVTGRLELVALDATDIVGLASFYAELTGAAGRLRVRVHPGRPNPSPRGAGGPR